MAAASPPDAELPASTRDRLLLAVFADDDTARAAWMAVAPTLDIDTLPFELHGLFPLLAERLRALGLTPIDLPRFDGVRKRLWSLNLLRARAVVTVADELARAGAQPLITGAFAVLAHAGNWGIRPLTEVDLVISADRADAVIRDLGHTGWAVVDRRRDGFLMDLQARVLERDGQRVTLRWSAGAWPHDGLAAASACDVAGATLAVASPADVLAYTITDAERLLGYQPVRRFADALLLCSLDTTGRAAMDWTAFTERVLQRKAAVEAVAFLQYLSGILRAPVPPEVIGRLAVASANLRPVGRVAAASDTVAAYVRRTRSGPRHDVVRQLPGYLCEVWDVDHVSGLPLAVAVRGVRAARRLADSRHRRTFDEPA